jgi:MarR family transcriptional regulator, 2-MHQ and catechol-resistance regulon repressor
VVLIKNEEITQSLHLLRVLVRSYNSVAAHSFRSSKGFGFNPTEFAVLELLYHKGPQKLNEIGTRLLLVSGGVTYVVDKMEAAGLVLREPSNKDRRVVYAKLTEKGRRIMEEISPKHAANLHEAFSGLTPEEKEKLIHLLKKMGKEAERKWNEANGKKTAEH